VNPVAMAACPSSRAITRFTTRIAPGALSAVAQEAKPAFAVKALIPAETTRPEPLTGGGDVRESHS